MDLQAIEKPSCSNLFSWSLHCKGASKSMVNIIEPYLVFDTCTDYLRLLLGTRESRLFYWQTTESVERCVCQMLQGGNCCLTSAVKTSFIGWGSLKGIFMDKNCLQQKACLYLQSKYKWWSFGVVPKWYSKTKPSVSNRWIKKLWSRHSSSTWYTHSLLHSSCGGSDNETTVFHRENACCVTCLVLKCTPAVETNSLVALYRPAVITKELLMRNRALTMLILYVEHCC